MMNLNETVTLLQIEQGMPLVDVRFLDDTRAEDNPGAIYTYKAATAHDLEPGDLVVVEARDTFSLARVVACVGPEALHQRSRSLDKLRHVVCKIERGPYFEVQAAEQRVRQALAMAEVNDRLASVRRFIPQDLRALPEPEAELVEEELPLIYPLSLCPTTPGGPMIMRYLAELGQQPRGATLNEYETPQGIYALGLQGCGWTLEQWGNHWVMPSRTRVRLGTEWFMLAESVVSSRVLP